MDLLVAGLGNPGPEHARDRHNVGWMVVDELARRHQGSFKGKFRGRLADVRVDDARLALLEARDVHERVGCVDPGGGARSTSRPVEQVLVVHDDVDLESGATAGATRRRARRPQRPPVDRGPPWLAATSSGCGSASGDRAAATRGRSPTTCSRPSFPEDDAEAIVAVPPTRSRCSRARASKRHSGASTDGAARRRRRELARRRLVHRSWPRALGAGSATESTRLRHRAPRTRGVAEATPSAAPETGALRRTLGTHTSRDRR